MIKQENEKSITKYYQDNISTTKTAITEVIIFDNIVEIKSIKFVILDWKASERMIEI